MKRIVTLLVAVLMATVVSAQSLDKASPESVGLNPKMLEEADRLIAEAAAKKDFPGAVFAVVRHGKLVHLAAFGDKQWLPEQAPMKKNTIFDLASVSKPTSTAVCTMILVERGKIRLTDKVKDYLPGFKGYAKEEGDTIDIRIADLLTHSSGLPAYAPVATVVEQGGANPKALLDYIKTCSRSFAPKSRFRYSCLNFITLQHVLEAVTGQTLAEFAQENVFDVLGMKDTSYGPITDKKKLNRVAPTEKQPDGTILLGSVHDPLARVLNHGNSGNAGVFSTAEDLAILYAALLNGGEINGHRIMGRLTVDKMFSVPDNVKHLGRTLGWDSYSSYAGNKGDLFSEKAVCHTGYTGTSVVLDPVNDVAMILLTNAVHPNDSGRTGRLRSAVANLVAGAIMD